MQKLFEFFCQLTKMLWLSDVSTSERQWALLLFQTVWMHLKSSLFLCVCVCVCVSSSRLSTLITSSSRFWTTWTITTRPRRGSEPASSRSCWRRWPSLPKDPWVSSRSVLVPTAGPEKETGYNSHVSLPDWFVLWKLISWFHVSKMI